jgi:Pyridine nucleotide-disulphide oxidoreductase
VQKADRLAEREDADVGDALRQALEKDGCRVYLNAELQRVEAAGAGVRVHLPKQTLEGTHLFLAVGRQPNTDDLGLNSVGVENDRAGYITVDDRLQTTTKRIWAAGDIRGGSAFTHAAYDGSAQSWQAHQSRKAADDGKRQGARNRQDRWIYESRHRRRHGSDFRATALCEQGSEVVQLFVELINSGARRRTSAAPSKSIRPTLKLRRT